MKGKHKCNKVETKGSKIEGQEDFMDCNDEFTDALDDQTIKETIARACKDVEERKLKVIFFFFFFLSFSQVSWKVIWSN